MRLLIIRHGDPDYKNDTLTAVGEREAKLLANTLRDVPIDEIYTSPLGRARKTAGYTLEAKDMTAEVLPWLEEFHYAKVTIDPEKGPRLLWDQMPAFYASRPELFDRSRWTETDFIRNSNVPDAYRAVTDALDAFLADHGYERDGLIYRVRESNRKTIAFFCHFGIESVLLSRILNVPLFALLNQFCALPSSVTTVVTEEREKGLAQFRCIGFGSTHHLFANGVEPSFSARFCETFDSDERH